MPWTKYQVQPVYLSRKPLPPDKDLNEFEVVSNTTFVGIIRQLSNLLQHSGNLFDQLYEDVLRMTLQTQKLQERMQEIQEKVSKQMEDSKEFRFKSWKPRVFKSNTKKKQRASRDSVAMLSMESRTSMVFIDSMTMVLPDSKESTTSPLTVTVNANRESPAQSKRQSHPKVFANRDSESWLQYFDQDSSESVVTPTNEGEPKASSSDTLHDDDTGCSSTLFPASTTASSEADTLLDDTACSSETDTILDDTAGSSDTFTEGDSITEGKETKRNRKHLSSLRPLPPLRTLWRLFGVSRESIIESVHSMDSDGYYTSMHNDTGVDKKGSKAINGFRTKKILKRFFSQDYVGGDVVSPNRSSTLSRSDSKETKEKRLSSWFMSTNEETDRSQRELNVINNMNKLLFPTRSPDTSAST